MEGGLFDGLVTGAVTRDIGWADGKEGSEGGGLAAGTGGLLEAITGAGVLFGGADGGGAGRFVISGGGAGGSYRDIGSWVFVCTSIGGDPMGVTDGGASGVAPAALDAERSPEGYTEGSKTVPPVVVLEATKGGGPWIRWPAGSFCSSVSCLNTWRGPSPTSILPNSL